MRYFYNNGNLGLILLFKGILATARTLTFNMDFSNETFITPELPKLPLIAAFTVSDQLQQSPVTVSITTVLAAIVSFLAYQWYRPSVHPQSPAFTKDTLPIIGSFGFVSRQW